MGNCFGSRYKVHEPFSQSNSGTFFYVTILHIIIHILIILFHACVCFSILENVYAMQYIRCTMVATNIWRLWIFFRGYFLLFHCLGWAAFDFLLILCIRSWCYPLMGLWRKWLWCMKIYCEWIDLVNLIWVWNSLCLDIFAFCINELNNKLNCKYHIQNQEIQIIYSFKLVSIQEKKKSIPIIITPNMSK